MTEITVTVGSYNRANNGAEADNRQEVRFEGEQLASRRESGYNDQGQLSDQRGTDETLYRTADGLLLVHVKSWSRWVGEPTTYTLLAIDEASLGPQGQYAQLGDLAGFGRPLTLDEYLSRQRATPDEP